MYFNLRNKFVKRKKIRKTFVNLLNFAWDDAGFALAAFHNVSKTDFKIRIRSLIGVQV